MVAERGRNCCGPIHSYRQASGSRWRHPGVRGCHGRDSVRPQKGRCRVHRGKWWRTRRSSSEATAPSSTEIKAKVQDYGTPAAEFQACMIGVTSWQLPCMSNATVTTASKRPRSLTHHSQPVNKSLLRTESPPLAGSVHAAKSLFAARMEWIALAISVVASVLLLGWVMLRCRSGFDFTDEGFYLNWISNPWNFRSSVTQFGFVYHPLYKLVGGDVVLLRQANVLILFALGWALCVTLLRSIFIRWDSIGASLGRRGWRCPRGRSGLANFL